MEITKINDIAEINLKIRDKLIEWAEQIHKNAIDKGFYPNGTRNLGELVMLCISELGEALEADRKNIVFPKEKITISKEIGSIDKFKNLLSSLNEAFTSNFELYVKDTVEDELADEVIRVLDLMWWKEIPIIVFPPKMGGEMSDNFGQTLLEITNLLTSSYQALSVNDVEAAKRTLNYAIFGTFKLAEKHNIDMMWHIQNKMRYNSLREKLHGKKY